MEEFVIYTKDEKGEPEILKIAKSSRGAKMLMTKLWNTGKFENITSERKKDFEQWYGDITQKMKLI